MTMLQGPGTLQTRNRMTVEIGPELGRGGEGVIYAATANGGGEYVAKLWDDDIRHDVDDLARVAATISDDLPTPGATPWARAAPVRQPIERNGITVGVLMPRLPASMLPLSDLLSTPDQYRLGLALSLRWHLRVAARLADAVHQLHARGIVLGDVCAGNVAVDPRRARLRLFDTDAWQMADRARPRRIAESAVAPEHIRHGRIPTFESDRWALAVCLLALPFEGVHPCDGERAGAGGEWFEVVENVRDGYSHLGGHPLVAGLGTPALSHLPAPLRDLAAATFGRGHAAPELRPHASSWTAALVQSLDLVVECASAPANDPHQTFAGERCWRCEVHAAARGATSW